MIKTKKSEQKILLRHLRFTKSDLKVGVGGPGWGDGAKLPGRPASGLLVTKRSGFGGGMNAGGNGGGRDVMEPSDDPSDLAQSLFFVKFCAADLFEEYN